MPNPSDLSSSESRPLPLRKRADLVCVRQDDQGREAYVVKDPLSLKYSRLSDQEWFVLSMLDGVTSLGDIRTRFESHFAPTKIALGELAELVANLHTSGLVYSAAHDQGDRLAERQRKQRMRQWLGRLTNPLAIRFRGVCPDRLFHALHPRVRWMFSPWALAAFLLLDMAALSLVVMKFDTFRARLPEFHQFFTFETTWMLMVTLAVVKILHEFGHGLACKHFGGECPELGAMLLVFTPCLYCNVSDAWMLKSKWQRITIGAAGMTVELVLASIATFVWWFTVPGVVNHLALNVMFVCSVSTILFNANPLMRYDGYFILADLIDMPNLAQRSTTVLKSWCTRALLGIEASDDTSQPSRHRFLLAAYAVASFVYRWIVVFSILWFIDSALKPYRLEVFARAMAVLLVGSMTVMPLLNLLRYLRVPGRSEQIERYRLHIAAVSLAILLAIVAFVPLPRHVVAAMELEPRDTTSVFVNIPGVLVEAFVIPGQYVERGTVLAQLENVELESEIAEIEAKRDHYASRVAMLWHRRFSDTMAGRHLAEAEKTLTAFDEQLEQKRVDQKKLTLVAERSGTVLPAPDQPRRRPQQGELATWAGSPLDRRNACCWLEMGTLFCRVGASDRCDALVVVEQSDVAAVRTGQHVTVKLDAYPERTFRGSVEEIARDDLKVSPRHLSNKSGGALSTKTDERGVERLMNVSYHVRVPVEANETLPSGCRGRAKIDVAWQSLGRQAWRWFWQTFHFEV